MWINQLLEKVPRVTHCYVITLQLVLLEGHSECDNRFAVLIKI